MFTQSLLVALLAFHACSASPADLLPSITDGQDALVGEFPYQVSVQWGIPPIKDYAHACGGSILNENYILTAGHCIMKFGKLRIAAGKHMINEDEDTEQIIDVQKAIVHKDYDGGVAQHDIAILRLAKPLVFNERVSAINLPQQGEMQTGNAFLSGWGSISKKFRPVLPPNLQKAIVPILDNDDCYEQLTSGNVIGPKPELFETQVCSGAGRGQVSACSGDSGGPLAQVVMGKPIQVGVVSWGLYPCGSAGKPSVYTRVSSYVDWINNIMA